MKNIKLNLNLIINIALALVLGIFIYLHFSLRCKVSKLESQPMAIKSGASNVVYINIDTLYAKYDMYIDLKAKLVEKQKKMEDDMMAKKNNYEKSVMDYQDKAKKGLLLRSEAEKIEQQLMYDQQNLYKLNENMQLQLGEETQRENRRLLNSIVEYLKTFNKGNHIQYVFGYAYGNSSFLYANDSLDITNEIVKNLNEIYKSEISKNK